MAENTYKAVIQYAGDEFLIGTTPSGHAQAIDTKGERKSAPSPMEMLLVSVGACTAVDVVSILQKKRRTARRNAARFYKIPYSPYRVWTRHFRSGGRACD
jgi:hypothetical protein